MKCDNCGDFATHYVRLNDESIEACGECAQKAKQQGCSVYPIDCKVDTVDQQLALMRDLISEVQFNHKDRPAYEYNECESEPCLWCQLAEKVLSATEPPAVTAWAVFDKNGSICGLGKSGTEAWHAAVDKDAIGESHLKVSGARGHTCERVKITRLGKEGE